MGILIDQVKCIGCGGCVKICPGNLIRFNENLKAYLKKTSGCWSCTSCMKECPASAISLALSPEMGGRGSRFYVSKKGKKLCWTVVKEGCVKEEIYTDPEESNKY